MTSEEIKDLKYQKELLQKEKKSLNTKIKLLQIELGQLKLRRTTVDEKIDFLSSEIYSQENIYMFYRNKK